MAAFFARLGLWGLVILLGLMIASEAFPEGPLSALSEPEILSILGKLVAGVLLLAGLFFLYERVSFNKSKCKTCGVKVQRGYIYCRQHLSNLVEREDQRRRTLTNVPTPDVSDHHR